MPRRLAGLFNLDLKIQAAALHSVRPYLTIGHSDVLGVHGIALQGFFRLEGAVEHHVGIRRGQTTINMNLDIEESGNLPHESFQTGLHLGLHFCLLFLREFWIQRPENNMLYHNLIY